MRRFLRPAARLALRVVTAAAPVVIAACYGPIDPQAPDMSDGNPGIGGKVVNKVSREWLSGISLHCISRDGWDLEATMSDYWGDFHFYPGYCATVSATDVDGPVNRSYESVVVPAAAEMLIEMVEK